MAFEQTMRWYGPKDPITLSDLKQTGITGIVTALHHIPNGEIWTTDEINIRKKIIEDAGLKWSVVESVPVHEDIKKQKGNYLQLIENYKQSIRNLGACGITHVCYNFMPVLDWSRTDVDWEFKDGSRALRFDIKAFAAFDIHILKRENADTSYSPKIVAEARAYFDSLSEANIQKLTNTILLGLPGSEEKYELNQFASVLREYEGINDSKLKEHLKFFLRQVIPVAEEAGVLMAIHPDDPPFSLLGLPRIVSTLNDLNEIIETVNSVNNGITLCAGSLGAGHFNDLVAIAKQIAHRVNFVHLRNVWNDEDGNFYEDNHLDGSTNMYELIQVLTLEERRRKAEGRTDSQMPMRPDHGHQMLDDLKKKNTPGYSLIGRLRGLAEIRGLEHGIIRSLNN
jgi:mannonate dehydratase